jgi:uncharacterized protein YcaQ
LKISIKAARRLALNCQLLDGRTKTHQGKEGIARIIEKLGYIQVDTIAVIERAHHHTLWTRCPGYAPEVLDELQAKDRRVFEYWGHAHSYLPMSDYRYYIPLMRRFENPRNNWIRQLQAKYGHLMEPVLKRVRDEGPLSSKDFEADPKSKRRLWWSRKPAKIALELLFWRGDLMISERRNFERVYDLTERVLPGDIDTSPPDGRELGRFLVWRALSAYGIAGGKEIREHLNIADKESVEKGLDDLIDSGEVTAVKIDGDENSDYYGSADCIERASRMRKKKSGIFILSPFDNLIIQRDRTLRIFGFDYALECYTPPSKRKFGYYILPVLWGEEFSARLDPKADRKRKVFLIRKLLFEPEFDDYDRFLPAFAGKLKELARFNQCDKIKIEKVYPVKYKGETIRLCR